MWISESCDLAHRVCCGFYSFKISPSFIGSFYARADAILIVLNSRIIFINRKLFRLNMHPSIWFVKSRLQGYSCHHQSSPVTSSVHFN